MEQKGLGRLVDIMNDLREKCPWDRKQTIHSLRQMTLEETYELTDAIEQEDWDGIKEELGDILLHVVFYAKIASEKNHFDIENVIHAICEKLITRHPHVYPPAQIDGELREVKNEEDVKQNWEKIKLKEGKKSVLSGVPQSLPSVIKAMRLQEKARQVGFEWENKEDVWLKVEEEMNELKEAVESGNQGQQSDELGDFMFSLINYARFLGVDADAALEGTNRKFKSRFTRMEEIAQQKGKNLADMTLPEMDELWNSVKTME